MITYPLDDLVLVNRTSGQRPPTRIGLVDDHPVFRHGLRLLLGRYADLSVEWEESNTTDLDQTLADHPVDVVLMDLQFGRGPDGLQATKAVKARRPSLRVIILSGSLDPDSPAKALAAGADAYLEKDREAKELVAAIRGLVSDPWSRSGRPSRGPSRLSVREREVLIEIRRGRTNREIASGLGISISTVNKHVQKVLKKLQVRNRVQAASEDVDHTA